LSIDIGHALAMARAEIERRSRFDVWRPLLVDHCCVTVVTTIKAYELLSATMQLIPSPSTTLYHAYIVCLQTASPLFPLPILGKNFTSYYLIYHDTFQRRISRKNGAFYVIQYTISRCRIRSGQLR